MTTITLTSEIELALNEEARRQGTEPETLALDCLRARFVPVHEGTSEGQGTLADFLAGHIGVISSREHVPGGARMSENISQKFVEGLRKKQRERRL